MQTVSHTVEVISSRFLIEKIVPYASFSDQIAHSALAAPRAAASAAHAAALRIGTASGRDAGPSSTSELAKSSSSNPPLAACAMAVEREAASLNT